MNDEFKKEYYLRLFDFVKQEYATQRVFPLEEDLFNALDSCSFDRVKVVILGQDPYHEPDQAHGLSFSVREGVKFPPSLVNIFKELVEDIHVPTPSSGDLSCWANQGVLLLNATLTVRAHQAGSHQGRGWEQFTDAIIHRLAEERENLVFILWGAYAQRKGAFIDKSRHFVIQSPHPSPLSSYRGFFGSKPFSQTNSYLQSKGIEPIDWGKGKR